MDENGIEEDASQKCPLLMNSVVLENVFKYLSAKDLLNIRLCCRTFNEVALNNSIIGQKFYIRFRSNFRPDYPIETRTIDNFLSLVSSFPIVHPFCRQFEFTCAVLKNSKISRFIQYFGDIMTCLSLISCVFETDDTVESIFSCPKLKKLQLVNTLTDKGRPTSTNNSSSSGDTVDSNKDKIFESIQPLLQLKTLELTATAENQAISENNLKCLLQLCPNLNHVQINTSILILERFSRILSTTKCRLVSKLNSIKVSDMDCTSESFLSSWGKLHDERPLHLSNIEITCCNVSIEFIKFIFNTFSSSLQKLIVAGGTTEILSYALLTLKYPLKLSHLTLPLSAINHNDGDLIACKIPKLKKLTLVSSLLSTFKTTCTNHEEESYSKTAMLKYLEIQSKIENECQKRPSFFQVPVYQDTIADRQEEFSKVLKLFPHQNITHLKVCLKDVTSTYLNLIWTTQPHLHYLALSSDFSNHNFCADFTGFCVNTCNHLMENCSELVSSPYCSSDCAQFRTSPYIGKLTNLKYLELKNWATDETSTADINSKTKTINFIITHGILHLEKLQSLKLNGFFAKDSSIPKNFLSQLGYCEIDGNQITYE